MSGLNEGSTHALRSISDPMYLKTGDPGYKGGGTYTSVGETERMQSMYENIFGPAGRDIKLDPQRQKRHQRWHPSDIRLPAALRGRNDFLTERVDGLITDATNSPFTKTILPYVYLDYPDHKIKWNVYSFDEGIASRVPYESAARVLPQTKRSFAGYTVRQGLAIAMEHNFMVSEKGRENFQNQLTQLVGSIQMTNDLDVHIALLQAPSYQKHMNEKYHDVTKTTSQICRQYVDLFGILQKIPNALDILIEDAKNHLKTWGSQPPTFLLCNGNLTTQLTMLPEKTNYLTNGPDGIKRLAQGPDLPSYRGLSIINSRKFSMDAGTAPRDLLRRRVRVAEYYRIPGNKPGIKNMEFEFYDQSRDSWFRLSWQELAKMAELPYDGPASGPDHHPQQHGRWAPVSGDSGSEGAITRMQGPTWEFKPLTRKLVMEKLTGAVYTTQAGVLQLHAPYGNNVSRHRMRTAQLEPLSSPVVLGVDQNSLFQYGCKPATIGSVDHSGKQREQAAMTESFGGMLFNESFVSDPIPMNFIDAGKDCNMLGGAWHCNDDTHLTVPQQYNLVYGILDVVSLYTNSPVMAYYDALADSLRTRMSQMKLNVPSMSLHNLLCATHEGRALDVLHDLMPLALVHKHNGSHNEDDLAEIACAAMTQYLPRLAKLILMCGASGDTNLTRVPTFTDSPDKITLPSILENANNAYLAMGRLYKALYGVDFAPAAGFDNFWKNKYSSMILDADAKYAKQGNAAGIDYNFHTTITTESFETYWTDYTNTVVYEACEKDYQEYFMLMLLGVSAYLKVIIASQSRDNKLVSILNEQAPALVIKQGSGGTSNRYLLKPTDETQNVYADVKTMIKKMGIFHWSPDDNFTHPACASNAWLLNSSIAQALNGVSRVYFTAAWDQAEQQVISRLVSNPGDIDPAPFFGEHDIDVLGRAVIVDQIYFILNTRFAYYNNVIPEARTGDGSVLNHLLRHRVNFDSTQAAAFANKFNAAVEVEMQCKNQLSEAQLARHHDTSNIMLATFDNATASQLKICAPNLHLSLCQPLNAGVIEHMPAFADPVQGTLQHALSTMPLANDVICDLLHATGQTTLDRLDRNTDLGKFLCEYKDSNKAVFTNKLMATVLHHFHPSVTVRDALKDSAISPTGFEKSQFCAALADALAANDRNSPGLAQALAKLVQHDGASASQPVYAFHSEQAATEQIAMPAFMTEAQAKNDFGRCVPIEQLPLRQYSNLSGVCALPEDKLDHYREVYMKQGAQAVPGVRGRMAMPLFPEQVFGVPDEDIEVHDVYGNVRHTGFKAAQEQAHLFHSTLLRPWVRSLPPDTRLGTNKYMVPFHVRTARHAAKAPTHFTDTNDPMAMAYSAQTQQYLRHEHNCDSVWRTVVLVLAQRFFRDTRRFCFDGQGMDAVESVADAAPQPPALPLANRSGMGVAGAGAGAAAGNNGRPGVRAMPPGAAKKKEHRLIRYGLHPCGFVPVTSNETFNAGNAGAGLGGADELADCDIIVLRPNIEHEMLGIIMGRGGTQELGCTFWGQTELSCYDDAQHGVWGMSYKYHERAIVTNERNMIRTFDVAFDGYNGGMDDSFVDWKDPESIRRFTQATYARDRPYNGPSMLVMALPRLDTQRSFPNPIVFHTDTGGNLSPDPQKDEVLPDIAEFMVFNSKICPGFCQPAQEIKYQEYMQKLGMFQWASVDQSSRPAGEACIANEATSNMLAFQGTMNIYDKAGNQRGAVMGSGHLGPSYVGVASVREGRGILNTHMQPQMIRQI